MLSFLSVNIRWIGGAFLLIFISSLGQTFFIGLSGDAVRERFELTDGGFGLIYMLATLGSALTLPWLGKTLDVMPGWKVVRFATPCLAVACLAFAYAPNVGILVAAIFLLRLFGQGMMTHIALTEVGRWFAANRGRATSLVVMGHQAGEGLLPITFVLASAYLGWQGAWVAAAIVLMLTAYPAILMLLRVERQPAGVGDAAQRPRTARDWRREEVLRDPVFYLLLVGVLAPPFIGTTVFFHQGHLSALRGYDPLVFAAAFPVMAITTVFFALICGYLIDRFSAVRILPFLLGPLAVASLAGAVLTPVWGVFLFMFLVGVSYGLSSTLLGALWPEVYGIKHLGGIRALIVSAMVLATAIGPGLTGWLIDQGVTLPQQLLWMSGWCVIATVALLLASRRILSRQVPA